MGATKNEHDATQYDPKAFISFRRINSGDGTMGYVYGIMADGRDFVQTVRFKAEAWTPEAAIRYLELNNFRTDTFELAHGLVDEEPIAAKVKHVRAARQTRRHKCHWPKCQKQVPPAQWGCKEHWFKLPKHLRDRIWATYSVGQETNMQPSEEYLAAAVEVLRWIKQQGATE